MRTGVVILCLAIATVAGPVVSLAAAPPPADGGIHLVVAPAGRRAQVLDAAGGHPVGPAAAPLAGLAASPHPGFAERLKKAGAWLVLDGEAVARLCGVSRT
jgi:hypothetical protein